MNLYPKFSCYTGKEICILDNLNKKVLVFNSDMRDNRKVINNPSKVYDINMGEYKDYWIDAMVLVNNSDKKVFIGRIVRESEFDKYVGRYVIMGEDDEQLKIEDLTINGKEQKDKLVILDDPMLFVKDTLVFNNSIGIYDYRDVDLENHNISKNIEKNNINLDYNYIFKSHINESKNFTNILIYIYFNNKFNKKIVLNYSQGDDFWYIQEYKL